MALDDVEGPAPIVPTCVLLFVNMRSLNTRQLRRATHGPSASAMLMRSHAAAVHGVPRMVMLRFCCVFVACDFGVRGGGMQSAAL